MSNVDRVYEFISNAHPRRVTNSDIASGTGISPHQQVFQITQRLLQEKRIRGMQYEKEWHFWVVEDQEDESRDPAPSSTSNAGPSEAETPSDSEMTAAQFETFAAEKMSRHFETPLEKGRIPGIPKDFDLVSPDQSVVGDAKYFTLVGGDRLPPAKFSIIAEYVWLLERTEAKHKFLVFGNDPRVPEEWLKRYGQLVREVEFFFLYANGTLQALNTLVVPQKSLWMKLIELVRQKT